MALEIVELSKIIKSVKDVKIVSVSPDFQLLSVLTVKHDLQVYLLGEEKCEYLTIKDVQSYAWQEDFSFNRHYRLLIANINGVFICYEVEIQQRSKLMPTVLICNSCIWDIHTVFENFQGLGKALENGPLIEVVKFETKEAILVFDTKLVVTLLLSTMRTPQIISFFDASEDGIQNRKMLLVGDFMFILNSIGSKISSYCISNNFKVWEFDFSTCNLNPEETGAIKSFVVSLELDFIVVYTEKGNLYWLQVHLWEDKEPNDKFLQYKFCGQQNSVTAFTKQFPSVKRLADNFRGGANNVTDQVHQVVLPFPSTDLVLQDMALSSGRVCLVFHGSTYTSVNVLMLGSDTADIYKRFEELVFIIRGGAIGLALPLLLLCENRVSVGLLNVGPEILVNELMVYPSSRAAEALSELNQWQNIRMDIGILRQGLQNRQLDTVTFFLKMHEEGFCQQWDNIEPKEWLTRLECELDLWNQIVCLVLDTIYQNIADTLSYQFAEQLLQIIISILVHLLSLIEKHSSRLRNISKNFEEYVSGQFAQYLSRARQLFCDQQTLCQENVECQHSEKFNSEIFFSSEILKQWNEWDSKQSMEDVVKESLLNGSTLIAASYLLNFHKNDFRDSQNVHEIFQKIGLNFILECLKQGQLHSTLKVLSHLGFHLDEKLLEIFRTTAEKDIRKLLLSELVTRNALTTDDNKLLHFVSILENLYPCTSFEQAKQLFKDKNSASNIYHKCAFPKLSQLQGLQVGDLLISDQNNCETGAYCRIVIKWISTWNQVMKERIIVPHFLKGTYNSALEVSPQAVWHYLLEYGNLPFLRKWIHSWLGLLPNHSHEEFPFKWSLSEAMINFIKEMSPIHIGEVALNELARYGVFCEDELEDISLFLHRLGHGYCNLNEPATFLSNSSSVSFSDLCHRIVHFCLRFNLIHFLYQFLSSSYQRFTTWLTCHLCFIPLFRMIMSFCSWSLNHEDSTLALNAILSSSQHLYNLEQPSLQSVVNGLPVVLAVAVLLFAPQSLSDIIKGEIDINNETLHSFSQAFPMLCDNLFKQERLQTDVSLYQLLQGTLLFDPSRLFAWQATNTIENEEEQVELPHFSLSTLSQQHGLKENLTYFYYLMEGRPNFSYLMFVAQELKTGKTLSLSRIKVACKQVCYFALSNYRRKKAAIASVIFLEMLGYDSLPLRVCLIAANIIYRAKCAEGGNQEKVSQEICLLFRHSEDHKETALHLMSLLETQIVQECHFLKIKCIMSSIVLWMPLMALSHLYEMDVSESFLTECATDDDWLRFLLFAQIFQVPKKQIMNLLSKFSNLCIANHLRNAMQKKSSIPLTALFQKDTHISSNSQRDIRTSLYSRIGVSKNTAVIPENSSVQESSDEEHASISSEETVPEFETSSLAFLKDVFGQLLHSHSTDIPWKTLLHASYMFSNPILALLAASYPDSSLVSCFTSWLATTIAGKKSYQKYLNLEDIINTSSEIVVENLLLQAVRERKVMNLWYGVSLFLPHSPLVPLTKFLLSFVLHKEFDSSTENLKNFQKQLWNHPQDLDSAHTLYCLQWTEKIAIQILTEAVITCSTSYERQLILRHLFISRIENSFSDKVTVPAFNKLYQMVQYLGDAEESINIKHLLMPENNSEYHKMCWIAVEKLQLHHRFNEAIMFAKVANISLEDVLLMQLTKESEEMQKMVLWKDLNNRISFWKSVLIKMKVSTIQPQLAAQFFKAQCEISNHYGEKFFLLQLALECLNNLMPKFAGSEVIYLKSKMWLYCVKAEAQRKLPIEILDVFQTELSEDTDLIVEDLQHLDSCILENETESAALERIIRYLLTKGHLQQAFRIARAFNYDCVDLTIVHLCLKLARGMIDPSTVSSMSFERNVQQSSIKKWKTICSWSQDASVNGLSPAHIKVILLMEKLCEQTEVAVSICSRIIVYYTVASILDNHFDKVTKEKNPFVILKEVLTSKYVDKFSLAKRLITVHDLQDWEVATFLSQEILSSLQDYIENPVLFPEDLPANLSSAGMMYNPTVVNEGFQLIVKLCDDPSHLGRKLLNSIETEAANLAGSNAENGLLLLVELCICAHECFTAACHTEGISQVLHKAQLLTSTLAEAKKFSVMIRLLTGIGRYSEMSYVFDILQEHQEFELLFSRGMEKVLNLRLALLDYLKRCPSADAEIYSMLALHFSMYREIAETLEISARELLLQLCKQNSDVGLKEELEIAMQDLADSSESYCKADCFLQAQLCAQLAQLVALQIFLLPSGTWIIGLDDSSVSRCIAEHNKFPQALIIAEAYQHHQSWSQAVFRNVINKGDWEYLHDLQSHLGLNTALIEDVAERFHQLPTKSESHIKNMKHLLSLCSDIEVKYQITNKLGFSDMALELLMGDGGSYLQDLITTTVTRRLSI